MHLYILARLYKHGEVKFIYTSFDPAKVQVAFTAAARQYLIDDGEDAAEINAMDESEVEFAFDHTIENKAYMEGMHVDSVPMPAMGRIATWLMRQAIRLS